MTLVQKIKAIRLAERLSQKAFAEIIDMKLQTLRNYEMGRRDTVSSDQLEKITRHRDFQKYALWLVTDKTAPEIGQISPDIEGEEQQQTSGDT